MLATLDTNKNGGLAVKTLRFGPVISVAFWFCEALKELHTKECSQGSMRGLGFGGGFECAGIFVLEGKS